MMRMPRLRGGKIPSSGGFTLVELLVAVAVLGIAAALLYGIFGSLYESWVGEGMKSDMRQNVRVALDTVTRDLQMAGYQTTGYGDANKANLAITVADTDEIELDQQWLDIATGVYEPRMVYYHIDTDVTTGRQNLYRQLRTEPGLPAADEIVAENVQSFSLSYFDGDGTAVTGLPASYTFGNAPPQALKDIRRICVSITTQIEREPPGEMQEWDKNLTLSSCVTPRNLTVEESIRDTSPPCTPAGLLVRDTRDCSSKLCVSWERCTDPDLSGYVIHYGPGRIKRVPVTGLADPANPQALLNADDLLITKHADRFTTPNQYSLSIAAYDTSGNYSSASAAVSGNPSPDLDTCGAGSTGQQDTTVNPAKPAPPAGLTVSPGAEFELVLSWTPPADGSATAGYRLYRSETPFADGHIDDAQKIAGEGTLTPETTTYTDPGLIGCRTYYYAVASVNCDETLVATYAHVAAGGGDYAVASGEPEDVTPPLPPSLEGTTGGWKRVFVNLLNPTVDQSPDFDRTEVYYSEGLPCPSLEDGAVANGQLVPDRNDSPLNRPGTFSAFGSQSFIFDHPIEESPEEPGLTNEAQYCIVSVAYDTCGNTSLDSSFPILIDLCGDDPEGPPPDWPINATYTSCDPSWVKLTWEYPPKDYTGPGAVLDFAGYRLWRIGPEPGTEVQLTGGPIWVERWTDSLDLQAGGGYRYVVRATDCVYENRHDEFPNNYSTALNIPSDTGWIYPGGLRTFSPGPENMATGPFVVTHSDGVDPLNLTGADPADFTYHNNVRFYLENTSAGTMRIDDMAVLWGNPNVVLESITVGGLPSSMSPQYRLAGGVPSGATVPVNVQVTETASGVGTASAPIPVTLRFTNFDGSVNRFTDMRSELLYVSSRIRNESMQQQQVCDPAEFVIAVPQGPVLGGYVQDVPWPFGSVCYEVTGPTGTARDDDLKVPSLTEVNVNGIALDNSSLDFERLSVVTVTAPTAPGGTEPSMPTGGTFQELPLQRLFGDNFAIFDEGTGTGSKLPLAAGEVVWYYILAVDSTGNFDRFPNPDLGECAYYQKPSDPCASRPEPPVLTGSSSEHAVNLSWTAPTSYVDGSGIPLADPLTYDVYISADGGGFSLAAPDLSALSYTHSAEIDKSSYTYAVVARNSCSAGPLVSDFSNAYQECEEEQTLNCDLFSVPPEAEVGQEVTVAARNVCRYASNGVNDPERIWVDSSLETKDFWSSEAGDTGTFFFTFTTTTCDALPQTVLAAGISATDTVIPLASTDCFPASGEISVGGETVSYSGILGGTLTGAVRGVSGTPAAHSAGSSVTLVTGGGESIRVNPSDILTVRFYVETSPGSYESCEKEISLTDPCSNRPLPPDPFDVDRTPGNREAVLTWGRPLFNTDGTPLADLAGYEIQFSICTTQGGGQCPSYSIYETLTLNNPDATTYTATDLQSARQGFKMRAFDTCGPTPNYSDWTEFIRRN